MELFPHIQMSNVKNCNLYLAIFSEKICTNKLDELFWQNKKILRERITSENLSRERNVLILKLTSLDSQVIKLQSKKKRKNNEKNKLIEKHI